MFSHTATAAASTPLPLAVAINPDGRLQLLAWPAAHRERASLLRDLTGSAHPRHLTLGAGAALWQGPARGPGGSQPFNLTATLLGALSDSSMHYLHGTVVATSAPIHADDAPSALNEHTASDLINRCFAIAMLTAQDTRR